MAVIRDHGALPPLYLVQQRFPRPSIQDLDETLAAELRGCGVRPGRGQRVAIATGSRGIANLARLIRGLVAWVKSHGAIPFIVPAMGSHGGATAEGQTALLADYGVTEDGVGAPVRATMDVAELPRGDLHIPVFMDRFAYEADATIVVNRIKIHTDYHGPYESGLMKMVAVGLGKQAQALELHRQGLSGLRDLMPRVARQTLAHGNVILGLGIIENAYDETCRIAAVPASQLPERELELLDYQRTCMPRLPTESADILIVDEMGKNISGTGLDTNIIGRMRVPGQAEPESPRLSVVVVRDITPESHGNALGIGLADITTRRLASKIDWQITYENIYTATFLERGRLPIVAETDREAMAFAVRAAGPVPMEKLRIVRIQNTLNLEHVLVSQQVLSEIRERSDMTVLGPAAGWYADGIEMVPFPQSH